MAAKRNWRRWLPVGLLLLCTVLAGSGGWLALRTLAYDQQRRERRQAEQRLQALLRQCRQTSAALVRAREAARAREGRHLAQLAAGVTGDVQVFLQAALVEYQARRARQEAERLRREKVSLERFSRRQREVIAELCNQLQGELDRQKQTAKSVTEASKDDFFSSFPLQGPELDKSEDLIGQELRRLLTRGRKMMAETERPALEMDFDEFDRDGDWPTQLVKACSTDLAGLLPPHAVLAVNEVGGGLLLRLGKAERGARILRGEASRSMLFQAGAQSRHWSIHMAVIDPEAPPPVDRDELAAALTAVVEDDPYSVRGFLLRGDDEVMATFPRIGNEQARLQPTRHGRWTAVLTEDGEAIARYETAAPQKPSPWTIGLQVTMPEASIGARMRALARENAGLVAAAGVTLLGLLIGAAAATGLALQRGPASAPAVADKEATVKREGAREVAENARVILADLGRQAAPATPPKVISRRVDGRAYSLKKLQQRHRGGVQGSSRILDQARSALLKQLVTKVRPPQEEPAPRDSLAAALAASRLETTAQETTDV